MAKRLTAKTVALPCRASPPQVGRLAGGSLAGHLERCAAALDRTCIAAANRLTAAIEAMIAPLADLPP
ncbi:hypothetical protein G6L72_19420 [Agrobacterium rubi]|uniref:Uncharacterized protein n=1 Tax=Agrobacterium rubi TaxID=28099 RepID=A0ABX2J831_9HYPH|nr:hypothetical protein [Agrobacterium rubi]NTF05101.1 hypothetical protein [Agrobacterium rubi]NTF38871.1 hypothetical protein [Agrobacterium rubi]